jgi:hypothetical protein
MSGIQKPPPPNGTSNKGCDLWNSIVDAYDLEEHEIALLREMVRCVDDLEELRIVIARDGYMSSTGDGVPKLHPAVAETRQLRLVLARLAASLRLPSGEDEDEMARPQRRGAARGTYRPRNAS